MKILIATFSDMGNRVGGLERALVDFSNAMNNKGLDVVLAYCAKKTEDFYYPLNPEVKKINLLDLPLKYSMWIKKKPFSFKIKRELLRLINREKFQTYTKRFDMNIYSLIVGFILKQENPDIIIGTCPRFAPIFDLADKIHKYPLITMCHGSAKELVTWMSEYEINALNKYDAIQVLMPSDLEVLKKVLLKTQLIWIPNGVPQYDVNINLAIRENLIVDVARLDSDIKRQHLLVEAFSKIADWFPNWSIEFWGDENGKYKYTNELKGLIHKYHLEDRVKLCGRTNDVLSVYLRASIFAFPSACEGFGLAIAEGMSAGLPVVAYRSCPAVNELVRDGETGLLVDDGVDALAEGLKKLMEDQELRERMGRAAHESMKEFAPEKIWDQWEALMQDVIAKHKMKMER